MTLIVRNLQGIRDRITTACIAAVRDPASVRLMAVTKTFGIDRHRHEVSHRGNALVVGDADSKFHE